MPSDLTVAQGRVVGQSWLWRMKQEQLAVSLFSQLAVELAELGCEPIVLEMITKAATDEVHHARACGQLAREWLGADAVPVFFHGRAMLPTWPEATREQTLALHIIEICCVSETLTGVFFTEMLERTSEPLAREIVRSLLADEIDHGRVGWAYVHELKQRGCDLSFFSRYLPEILKRQVADVVNPPGGPDDDALEAHGFLGHNAAAEVYRRGLADVVVPGFAQLGITCRW